MKKLKSIQAMDQEKIVEDSLQIFWTDMACLNRPYTSIF